MSARVLLIDNYDSFTYNLVQYLGELYAEVEVVRNDEVGVDYVLDNDASHIMISPGPCTPNEAGISMAVIEALVGDAHDVLVIADRAIVPTIVELLIQDRVGADVEGVDVVAADVVGAPTAARPDSWMWTGLNWSAADIDALEIGLRHAGTYEVRAARLYAKVFYQP